MDKTNARKMSADPTIFEHKKCIFSKPIGILLVHIIYKEGIKVELAKIKVILDLKPPANPKQIKIFLGHIGYYRKFIIHYFDITYPMDELFRIGIPFYCSKECQDSFHILKRKLVEDPILRFPICSKKFHVHIDSSALVVDVILTQPVEDGMDHPNAYESIKLNKPERKYSPTQREGLGIVFTLQKY